MSNGYDVQRLTAAGPTLEHYDGTLETDGPWLIVHGPSRDLPQLIVPAHAVVSVTPCQGRCSDGE